MHRSVKATIACAVFAAISMVFCVGALIFGDLTFKTALPMVSGFIGAGALLLLCLWLLADQWHQPMYEKRY